MSSIFQLQCCFLRSMGEMVIRRPCFCIAWPCMAGRVNIKMKAPLMLDFDNRSDHPYNEFPEGIKITTIEKNGDSMTIEGDYARSYKKTSVSEIRNNVVIFNYADYGLVADLFEARKPKEPQFLLKSVVLLASVKKPKARSVW